MYDKVITKYEVSFILFGKAKGALKVSNKDGDGDVDGDGDLGVFCISPSSKRSRVHFKVMLVSMKVLMWNSLRD